MPQGCWLLAGLSLEYKAETTAHCERGGVESDAVGVQVEPAKGKRLGPALCIVHAEAVRGERVRAVGEENNTENQKVDQHQKHKHAEECDVQRASTQASKPPSCCYWPTTVERIVHGAEGGGARPAGVRAIQRDARWREPSRNR